MWLSRWKGEGSEDSDGDALATPKHVLVEAEVGVEEKEDVVSYYIKCEGQHQEKPLQLGEAGRRYGKLAGVVTAHLN
jgi:hypothetical protein